MQEVFKHKMLKIIKENLVYGPSNGYLKLKKVIFLKERS